MPELLTAKDAELKVFKKVSFGGYSVPDVEEFMNQIAEDLEAYALRLGEQQHRIHELEDALRRHEAMKDSIKDALILAQQSARDKDEEARRQAGLMLAKAESRVGEIDAQNRRRIEEADSAADGIVSAARDSAAQIIKSAEDAREEVQKRLNGLEAEIARRMEEAGVRAGEMTSAARRELDGLAAEKRRFLRDSGELASAFARLIGDAEKAEKKTDAVSAAAPDAALDRIIP